jgi:hypothetical protein
MRAAVGQRRSRVFRPKKKAPARMLETAARNASTKHRRRDCLFLIVVLHYIRSSHEAQSRYAPHVRTATPNQRGPNRRAQSAYVTRAHGRRMRIDQTVEFRHNDDCTCSATALNTSLKLETSAELESVGRRKDIHDNCPRCVTEVTKSLSLEWRYIDRGTLYRAKRQCQLRLPI